MHISKQYRSPILLLCLAGLFSFYDLFQLTWFNVISENLLFRFNTSATQVGLLSSAFFWGNAIAIIPIGLLLDQRRVRTIALALLALTSTTNFVLATTHWFSLCVLMRFFQGFSSAASLLISMRLATTLFPKSANQAACVIGVFASLGGIFGNWGFGQVFAEMGLSSSLFLAGGVGWILWGVLVIAFKNIVEPGIISVTNTSSRFTQFSNVVSALRHGPNVLAGLYLGFINTPIFILGSLWGVFYFEHSHAQTTLHAVDVTTMIFLGLMLGAFIWGWLTRYISANSILISAVLLLIITVAYIFLNVNLSFSMLLVCTLTIGILCSTQNLMYPIIRSHNSAALVSTAMSVAACIFNFLGAMIQPSFSQLITINSKLTFSGFYYFSLAMLVALGCLLILFIKYRSVSLPASYSLVTEKLLSQE